MSSMTTASEAKAQLRLLRLLEQELLTLHPSASGLIMGLKCASGAGMATQEVIDTLETSRSTLARWERGIGLPQRPLELVAMFGKLKELFVRHIDATEQLVREFEGRAHEPKAVRPRPRDDTAPGSATPA